MLAPLARLEHPASPPPHAEDYGGRALHPVDLMSATTGALMGQLVDANLTTISPVNRFHPRRDIIISGSSRWAGV